MEQGQSFVDKLKGLVAGLNKDSTPAELDAAVQGLEAAKNQMQEADFIGNSISTLTDTATDTEIAAAIDQVEAAITQYRDGSHPAAQTADQHVDGTAPAAQAIDQHVDASVADPVTVQAAAPAAPAADTAAPAN